MEKAKELITEYLYNEFGEDYDNDIFKDLHKVPLAYTEDEEYNSIQVYADLVDCKIERYVNDILNSYEEYDDLNDMIECQLSCLDFDELINSSSVCKFRGGELHD